MSLRIQEAVQLAGMLRRLPERIIRNRKTYQLILERMDDGRVKAGYARNHGNESLVEFYGERYLEVVKMLDEFINV